MTWMFRTAAAAVLVAALAVPAGAQSRAHHRRPTCSGCRTTSTWPSAT